MPQNNQQLEAAKDALQKQWDDFERLKELKAEELKAKEGGRYPVTPRQRSFVRGFIQHWNGPKAYVDAGYEGNPSGWHRLMKVPAVAASIQYELSEAAKRAGITAQQVLELAYKTLPKLMGEEDIAIPYVSEGVMCQGFAKKFHAGETNAMIKMLAQSTNFFEGGSSPDKQVIVNLNPNFEKAVKNAQDPIPGALTDGVHDD